MTLRSRFACVFVLLLSACGAESVERVDSNAAPLPSSEPVVASTTDFELSAPLAEVARHAIEAPPGARRWSDVVAPFDAHDGSAIDDAWIVHIAPSGEREVLPLRAAVRDDHLAEGSLLAIDGAHHAARYFLPSHLPVAGEPARATALSHGNTVTIEAVDETTQLSRWTDLALRVTFSPLDDWSEKEDPREVGHNLRRVMGVHQGPLERRERLERVLANSSLNAFVGLDGPAPILRVPREWKLLVSTFPYTLHDVPIGWEFELAADESSGVVLGTADTARETWSQRFEFEARAQVDHVVQARCRLATLVARTPSGVSDVRYTMDWDTPPVQSVVDQAGEIRVVVRASGHHELLVRWTDPDGMTAVVVRTVHLEADGVVDLGELSAFGGSVVCVEPRIVVAGERDASAEAALTSVSPWSFTLLSLDHDYYETFEQTSLAPRIVRVDGLKSFAIADVSSPSREMRRAFAREGLALRSTPRRPSFDVDGDTIVPIEFVCRLEPLAELSITVPPLPGNVRRELLGLVFTPSNLRSESIEFDDLDPDPSRPWTLTTRIETHSDAVHEVTVVAVAHDRRERAIPRAGDAPPSSCAVRTFEQGGRRLAQVALELAPASAAVIHDGVASGSGGRALGVQPLHGVSRFADLYEQTGLSSKPCTFVSGLVPGVRYRLVRGSDIEFVAPPAGETLHLEPRSR